MLVSTIYRVVCLLGVMLVIYEYGFGLVQWCLNMNEWDSFFCCSNTGFGFCQSFESSWYIFCNDTSQTWFHHPFFCFCFVNPFITIVQRWQFRKGHDCDTTYYLQRLSWMSWHNSSFILTWKMYQTNLKLLAMYTKVELIIEILCFSYSWPKMIMSYGSEL